MLTPVLFTTLTSAEILNSRVADRLNVLGADSRRRMGQHECCRYYPEDCPLGTECPPGSQMPGQEYPPPGQEYPPPGQSQPQPEEDDFSWGQVGDFLDWWTDLWSEGRRLEGDLEVETDIADELPEQRRLGRCRRDWDCNFGMECASGTCKKSDGGFCSRDRDCASDYCRHGKCTEDSATARNGGGGFGRRRAEEDLNVAGEDLQMDLVEDEEDDRRRVVWCKTNKDCRTGWGERSCSQSGGFCVAGTGKGTTGNACSYDDHCNTNAGFTCTGSPSSIGTCQRRAPPPPSKKSNGQWCSWDGDCQSNFCRSGLCASKWGR
jgi:hypothetical protein